VLLAALGSGCWLALCVLLAQVVGRVFLGHQTLAATALPLLGMLSLVLVRGGLLWSGEAAAQRAADTLKHGLRARIAARLVALGPAHTRGQRAGELVYVAGEAVEALDAYVTRYLPARALSAVVPVLVALLVLALDPWSLVILLFAWPVLLLLLALIGIRVRDLTERRERELAWMNAHFLDMLRGLPTLELFGRSADAATTIQRVSTRHAAATMDVLRTAFQSSLVLEWGAVGATAMVAIETSVRVMSGGLAFDHALAALLLAPEFFLPLRRLSLEYHAGKAGAAAASRVHALLDLREPRRATGGRRLPARHDLRFDDVRVAYDGGARPALRGFSLEVADGQMVALVGPTGAGKSTVGEILLRFLEPDGGSVEVGGTPLADLDPRLWRTRVAWVPQHPALFHGTIAANIRLARPEASDQEVVAAARAAQAHQFISDLPAGYGTEVGEGGSRLSGGERQRLALARAILKDAPLLILDEATSHLDEGSQSLVLEALHGFRRGRTVLLIAHRAEVAAEADLVAVMDAGRVVGVRPRNLAPAASVP
jgi:thiol reductant ABC exporter CydD subunit